MQDPMSPPTTANQAQPPKQTINLNNAISQNTRKMVKSKNYYLTSNNIHITDQHNQDIGIDVSKRSPTQVTSQQIEHQVDQNEGQD